MSQALHQQLEIAGETIGWVRDVPFRMVPKEIVRQFKGHRFTEEEFYASDIWACRTHWNSALYENGRMVLFVYGTFDPLEKDLFVKRIAAIPEAQVGPRNFLVQAILNEVESIARQLGAVFIWTMASRKGLFRKGSGRGIIRMDKFIWENEDF